MFKTPQRNEDLRQYTTELNEQERREAIAECERLRQKGMLGSRYLLHRDNAPKKGTYNPLTGARISP